MKELDIESVMPALAKAVDATAAQMHAVHGRYWESRLDVCKTVLTITAAVLVGTVSFSSSLIGPGKEGLVFPSVLFISWALFVLSGMASLYAMWHLYKLNSNYVLLTNNQPAIQSELDRVGPKESEAELKAELNRIVVELTNRTLSPLKVSDQHSHYSLSVQLMTFGAALVCFFGFGVAQIL
ncbi:hypothetical protein [Marinobacter subterrani]|uniref:hypothetical protein n=1 Tax=Marinobacter subterrani TaxID=1658765 RepID=UPI002357E7B2|nr:hypothetical protein [Marinobacter subterrani]